MLSPALRLPRPVLALLVCIGFLVTSYAAGAGTLGLKPGQPVVDGDFELVREGRALPVVVEPGSGDALRRAAGDLAADLVRVSGAQTGGVADAPASFCILVGRVGAGGLIDQLVAEGRLQAGDLKGLWEATLLQVLDRPLPGVERALVVAGSDERGAIFGLYDVSRAIGVSPWHWWADLPPRVTVRPAVHAGVFRQGPPAVQYRGIFINDEDWGLQPWAAKTHEPECGDIGPKTYARVCELLLRLRANTLWPAMHACTAAFNANPENARVAARHGIVMGSSHAEPMLRNNVREWTADPKTYDFAHNPEGVSAYWEERVRANAAYENLWTLGMRGIHDSGMQGVKGVAEQRVQLERIFAVQRDLLDKYVPGGAARAPQVFCAYKEVLEVYRSGLAVPPEVMLMWPDDNFGYIRNLPSEAEAARPGGSGIYYHISYLGRPLSYLWLATTPPALIWEEMTRAWHAGARREWILNVGDIKPAELGMEFFLGLAWDADRRGPDAQPVFLQAWAEREFGSELASDVAKLLSAYYLLNASRKPEHLQGWLPGETPRPGPFGEEEAWVRRCEFGQLVREAERLASRVPADRVDAFFELVLYPVRGSAMANERFLAGEAHDRLVSAAPEAARLQAALAWRAHRQLEADTLHYNETLAGGKWRHLMSLEPADRQWKGMRIEAPRLPPEPSAAELTALPAQPGKPPGVSNETLQTGVRHDVSKLSLRLPSEPEAAPSVSCVPALLPLRLMPAVQSGPGPAWRRVSGLGRRGDAVALMPGTDGGASPATVRLDCERLALPAGTYDLELELVPTHPTRAGATRRLAVLLDDVQVAVFEVPPADGGAEWSRAVLEQVRRFKLPLNLGESAVRRLVFTSTDTGLVIDRAQLRRVE